MSRPEDDDTTVEGEQDDDSQTSQTTGPFVASSVSPERRSRTAEFLTQFDRVCYSLQSTQTRNCDACDQDIGVQSYIQLKDKVYHDSCVQASRKRKIPADWCSVCHSKTEKNGLVYTCANCTVAACPSCFVHYLLHANRYSQECRCFICKKLIVGLTCD